MATLIFCPFVLWGLFEQTCTYYGACQCPTPPFFQVIAPRGARLGKSDDLSIAPHFLLFLEVLWSPPVLVVLRLQRAFQDEGEIAQADAEVYEDAWKTLQDRRQRRLAIWVNVFRISLGEPFNHCNVVVHSAPGGLARSATSHDHAIIPSSAAVHGVIKLGH
ncbi:hypothetical protein CYLTODRAFT_415143 [Cylindrobasidium torrendii FP15055 ss-10]|uniref:Secreted protein n=1 Tax=Cylindrobasidium torrendii FP15055 ss-10 TaxID=1314674 RepID=A0A0D7AVH7_9AGAR|nr:hypothetical protein CYLTODRAFT_415143 [Cylindrobasidium torrendii FP15055 ss-10]